MTDVVRLERLGAIALVTVNNPPVNALGVAVRQGLLHALRAAEADAEVRAVALVCAGNTFFAGADIKEFGQPPQAPARCSRRYARQCPPPRTPSARRAKAMSGRACSGSKRIHTSRSRSCTTSLPHGV